jgi:hypothetical protein
VWGGLALWLALNEPDLARLCAIGQAADHGLVPALIAYPGQAATVAILGERELAALVPPQDGAGEPFQVAARGFGPGGGELARRLVEHVQAWDRHDRPSTADLRIRAYPAGAEVGQGAHIIDKRHTRIAVDWG